MSKIDITRISDELRNHQGFDHRGCFGTACDDKCCQWGADVDREAYDLTITHRNRIGAMLGRKVEECFEPTWSGETDFLGQNSIATTIINGTCSFRNPTGRGCVLFYLAVKEDFPKRIVPSTCRLFPISWDKGEMILFKGILPTCNCLAPDNPGSRKVLETQQEAMEDIFQIRLS
ncbi:MAG: hypothetical protein KJ950_16285 [Proteobacteria bacterium]|nr:hypothetical protein [Pseudomonadota bacterium]MBU1685890.1 hypothetical protein [Pseudomonadota bacterium]